MELKDCLTGLAWYPVNQRSSATKMAQKRMAEKHLTDAVWVLCASRGDKKQRKTVFAIANRQANSKVAAAAAFARAVTHGIIVERVESGFYWVAVAVQGVPMPGFDREYALDDAKSTTQALIDQFQFEPEAIHVPDDFGMHHEGCQSFAQLTDSLPTMDDVVFRRIDRRSNRLVIVAAAVGAALIFAVGGYFWWQVHIKHEEALKLQAALRAHMALLNHQRALHLAHEQELHKALKTYNTAMAKLKNAWSNSISILAGEYVNAMVDGITPSWGWSPVSFSVTDRHLISTWVSDIPGHPDYLDFKRWSRKNGWHVMPNNYYTQSYLSRPVPDALNRLVINPGFPEIGLLLNCLSAKWKIKNTENYQPLPYLQKKFAVTGTSLSTLAQTLHVLKQVPGVRIRSMTVADGGWSMEIGLFEKTAGAQTVAHGENAS